MPTEIDKDLVTALKQARGGKAMQFVYIAKSASEGKLLVSKNKIPPKEVAEAKTDLGGGALFKGKCKGVDGEIVFELAKEPPATLQGQLKRRLKEDAGLTWTVVIRTTADAEAEGEESEEDEAAPPAPPAPTKKEAATPAPTADPAEEWKSKLAAWTPAIKAALTAKVPAAADIQKLLAQAVSLSKPGGDLPLALSKLTEAHTLAGGSGTAPTAPPAAPPKAPDVAAILKAKQAEWLPAIKAALLAKGPNSADIQKLMQESVEAAKPGGNLVTALGKLKAANDLASRSKPDVPVTPPTTPVTPPPSTGGDVVVKRFNALGPALKEALAAKGPNVAQIQTLAQQLGSLIKNKDYTAAATVLDKLDTLLSSAPPTAPSAPKPASDPAAKQLTDALKELGPKYLEAVKTAGDRAVELKALMTEVTAHAKAQKYADGLTSLEKLKTLLAEVAGGASPKTGTPPPPPPDAPAADEEKETEEEEAVEPKTPFVKAREKYTKSVQLARDEVKRFTATVLADKDVRADERFDEIKAAVAALPEELAGFDDRLADALDKAANATDADEQTAATAAARKIVAEYQSEIDGRPILRAMDADTGFGSFRVYKPLAKSLAQLAESL